MPEDFNPIYGTNLDIIRSDFHVLWMGNTAYTDSLGDMDALAMWLGMSV